MSEFMSMSATKLVDIVSKHKSQATSQVEGAVAEITRRVAKGCKQPITQEWLTQVLTAYANPGTSIPRKATVAKRMAEAGTPTRKVPAKGKSTKPVSSTTPRFAAAKKLSDKDLEVIFQMEAQDSGAITFRPIAAA